MTKMLRRKDIPEYKKEKGLIACPVTLETLTAANAVLDHDHKTGHCRKVIDRNFNQFLGKTERNYDRFIGYKEGSFSLTALLRRTADYLDEDYRANPLHPSWVEIEVRRFGRENKAFQVYVLEYYGIEPAKTSKERTRQFKKWRQSNMWIK